MHAKISLRKLSKSVPVKVWTDCDKASNVSSITALTGHVTIVGVAVMDRLIALQSLDISQVIQGHFKHT